MKLYGIVIQCCDSEEYYYTDHITKIFKTKEEAEKELKIAMEYELESLGENFKIYQNTILNKYEEFISEYSIKEFELDD